jgi:hypothetical protein
MPTSSPVNPYEPPREAAPVPSRFSDQDAAELAELRRRVADLEKRVGRSWIVHSNFFLRICGVWGYWLLGYLLIVAVVFSVMLIVRLITGKWPS